MSGRVIAFAGPCLAPRGNGAREVLSAEVDLWPPARRGDVLLALGEEPAALVILDGFYYTVPAVTHKEILYALDAGVPVYGAASLGALRAAEMAAFGMCGVGRVFSWFDEGALDGDDEVAILHAGPEEGYRAFTVALVEVRYALEGLVAAGSASVDAAARLVAALKSLPFGERDAVRIDTFARELLGADAALSLARALAATSVKELDAREALAAACAEPAPTARAPASPQSASRLDVSTFLSFFREWHLRVRDGGDERDADETATYQHAWSVAQVLHPDVPAFVAALRGRFLLLAAALTEGLEPSDEARRRHVERLREHLADSRHRLKLPASEIEEEALEQALAEAAWERYGNLDAAAVPVARRLGLGAQGAMERLLELLHVQDDLLPQWSLIRAFLFTSAIDDSLDVASSSAEIDRAFRAWAGAARVAPHELVALAASLWSSAADEGAVVAAAGERALYRSHGFAAGLDDALSRLAAAERLRRPLNDYPQDRERLRAAALEPVLPMEHFRPRFRPR